MADAQLDYEIMRHETRDTSRKIARKTTCKSEINITGYRSKKVEDVLFCRRGSPRFRLLRKQYAQQWRNQWEEVDLHLKLEKQAGKWMAIEKWDNFLLVAFCTSMEKSFGRMISRTERGRKRKESEQSVGLSVCLSISTIALPCFSIDVLPKS